MIYGDGRNPTLGDGPASDKPSARRAAWMDLEQVVGVVVVLSVAAAASPIRSPGGAGGCGHGVAGENGRVFIYHGALPILAACLIALFGGCKIQDGPPIGIALHAHFSAVTKGV